MAATYELFVVTGFLGGIGFVVFGIAYMFIYHSWILVAIGLVTLFCFLVRGMYKLLAESEDELKNLE
jgi:hypothetical protein